MKFTDRLSLKKYWVKKMLKPNEIGRSGEERTQKYLLKNGYEILDTNFHSRWGEIDIVAKKGRIIAFVEVKARAVGSIVRPVEAVNKKKIEKLIKTAWVYIQKNSIRLQPRFDICEVEYYPDTQTLKIVNYIKNAFMLEDDYAVF